MEQDEPLFLRVEGASGGVWLDGVLDVTSSRGCCKDPSNHGLGSFAAALQKVLLVEQKMIPLFSVERKGAEVRKDGFQPRR